MSAGEWIPFGFGALIMVWGLWSAIFAFSGGQGSGLPHIVAPGDRPEADPDADREAQQERQERRRRRQMLIGQAGNFLLAAFVSVATVAMVVAALVIGH